jgi:hypothetical protein
MVDLAEIQTAYYMVAATGVLVAAVFYILNLRISQRNQELMLKAQEQSARAQQQTLETRQAQMFMNIYQQTTSKDFTSAYNKFISSQWENYSESRELFQKKEFADDFYILGMYFEGLGVLVKEGYLPIRLVALLLTGMTRSFWEKLKPIVDEARVDMGYVRWFSEAEYLYDELLRYLDKHPELWTELKNPPKTK